MKSVYIHIPFCSNICTYCDFCKMFYNEKIVSNYLEELKKEVYEKYQNEKIETLYIGGGTPSCLKINELEKLFEIVKIFNLENNQEFTIECNINDITKEKIELFKENKVNRISIGIQTFNEKVLKEMNRFHTYEEVKEKIELIKNIGINNINIDLIYAFPNTTLEDLKKDLELFLSLNINHISTYSLMIEPHTVLYNKKYQNISEDLDYEMYSYICNTLKGNGFKHYEISNFAKDGYESKHNLVYWNNEKYYGFGLNASGYINNIRYTNTRSLNKYLNHEYLLEEEKLDLKDEIIYELILGLRKIAGINIELTNKKFNIDLLNNKLIKEQISKNNLLLENNYLKIPYDKIYIQNEILMELLNYE